VLGGALVTVWDRAGNAGQPPQIAATFGPVLAMQACDLSADGRYAVTAAGGFDPVKAGAAAAVGDIRIWDVERQQRVAAITADRLVNSVAFSPADPQVLAAAGVHRNAQGAFAAQVYRWNAEKAGADLVAEVGHHAAPLVRVRFSADGRRLLTASQNGQVQVFDAAADGFAPLATNHELSTIVSAALNADGTMAVLADSHSAYLLNVATGQLLAADTSDMRKLALTGHSRNLTDVRFESVAGANAAAADQIKLWTTSLDGTAKLWSVTPTQPQSTDYTAKTLLTLRGHDRGVLSLDVSADGVVVTAGQDGRAIVWPLSSPNLAGNEQTGPNRLDARLADR
jgi:WD40 repeat protein